MNRSNYDRRAYEGTLKNTAEGGVAVTETTSGLETKLDTPPVDPRDILDKFPNVDPKKYLIGGAE